MIITGSSSGLGAALAIALSKQGVKITLFARNQKGLEETQRQCPSETIVIPGDVTKPEDCKRAIEETVKTFGSIDHLVLNAGLRMCSRFENTDLALFKTLIDTNYLGAVYFTHYALPYIKQSRGLITAISSIQGKIPVPMYTGYSASKHALQGFFDSLRSENPDLDILLVSPSWIGTNGLPLNHCVQSIISSMQKRKKELFLPKKYIFIPWLKLLCPRLLNWTVARAVKKRKTT